MDNKTLDDLGPLGRLVGVWEGDEGEDTAPSDDRGTEHNKFRERMVMEPTGLVQNHEQNLYGLRYHLQAWRLDETGPFHDEVGYLIWDAKAKQVMKCVTIPRGEALIAGAKVEPDAKHFKLTAKLGSPTFGVCSNPFLDREFQTVSFDFELTLHDDGSFSYDEVTKIRIKGQEKIFEHRDKNRLRLVK